MVAPQIAPAIKEQEELQLFACSPENMSSFAHRPTTI
jgi:hypothetical protein